MQSEDPVIAILCADLHLTLTPPIARAREKDWLEAVARPLEEIQYLAVHYDCPVICAGDIFDTWRSMPELINFAIDKLPKMYAIPGQHDTPLHNIGLLHRSAFATLVAAGVIEHLEYGMPKVIRRNKKDGINASISLYGVPWDHALNPLERKDNPEYKYSFHLAVCHRYVHTEGKSYPGASQEQNLGCLRENVQGYDAVVFGDNHKGFLAKCGNVPILNCGTMLRRKSDEISYRPQVGLLHLSGKIEAHLLNIEKDIIESTDNVKREEIDTGIESFLKSLSELQGTRLDFVEAIKNVMDVKVTAIRVRQIILEALDG